MKAVESMTPKAHKGSPTVRAHLRTMKALINDGDLGKDVEQLFIDMIERLTDEIQAVTNTEYESIRIYTGQMDYLILQLTQYNDGIASKTIQQEDLRVLAAEQTRIKVQNNALNYWVATPALQELEEDLTNLVESCAMQRAQYRVRIQKKDDELLIILKVRVGVDELPSKLSDVVKARIADITLRDARKALVKKFGFSENEVAAMSDTAVSSQLVDSLVGAHPYVPEELFADMDESKRVAIAFGAPIVF